jgi:tetratricopeptide (TPR) repeat protein
MTSRSRFIFRIVLFLSFAGLSTHSVFAQYHYDFNKSCDEAYIAYNSMQIPKGNALVQAALKESPQNLVPVFIAGYGDFLTLMFNGNRKDYQMMMPRMEERLSRLQEGDKSSPWYLYCIAVAYFRKATVHLRFNETLSGAYDFRKSYLALKENKKKFPAFAYNQVLLGLEEAIIGTVPDHYKWIVRILGMSGEMREGVNEIYAFLQNKENTHLRIEATAYYCFLKFYLLSDKEGTWQYLRTIHPDTKNNMLYVYMQAAFALDDNQAGLAEGILMGRNQSSAVQDIPLFDYLTGRALLNKMDDRTVIYFERFIKNYKGRFFIKDACQKMCYYYVAIGDPAKAETWKNKIPEMGTSVIDADRQAERFAKSEGLPNPVLLRARLYCDGGYFSKALAEMDKTKPSALSLRSDLLEYYYRYGKTYFLMDNPGGAIPFYKEAIKLGEGSPSQFPARSALDLGLIYEQKAEGEKAAYYYRLCLSMKDHDFKSSMDQKAKAGLLRLQQ